MIHSLIQTAYPQALAKLLYTLNNIQDAEDYLQSAVEKALIEWPKSQPENGVAWLVKVARNKFIDNYRRQKKQLPQASLPEAEIEIDLSEQSLLLSYNDDLLRLIFTSCHPALNQETQIALSLKHVLGLTSLEIAHALVIPHKTLQQRLIRAKKKIATNHIGYEIPAKSRWDERIEGVLKTIYLLFNEGYLSTTHASPIRADLCRESIRLARLLHAAVKDDSAVIGLLALLLHQDARRPARFDVNGQVVLLEQQDRKLWKPRNIQEANTLVYKALKQGRATPYAIQAAIAALHNNAKSHLETDWKQIYGIYLKLIELEANPVIKLNAYIAQAKSGEFEQAIKAITDLQDELSHYQYYYPAIAGLYFEKENYRKALTYYQEAEKIATDNNQLGFMEFRISECKKFI